MPPVRIADSSHGTILRSNDIESGILHAKIAILGRRAGHEYRAEIEACFGDVVVALSGKKSSPKDDNVVYATYSSLSGGRCERNDFIWGAQAYSKRAPRAMGVLRARS